MLHESLLFMDSRIEYRRSFTFVQYNIICTVEHSMFASEILFQWSLQASISLRLNWTISLFRQWLTLSSSTGGRMCWLCWLCWICFVLVKLAEKNVNRRPCWRVFCWSIHLIFASSILFFENTQVFMFKLTTILKVTKK